MCRTNLYRFHQGRVLSETGYLILPVVSLLSISFPSSKWFPLLYRPPTPFPSHSFRFPSSHLTLDLDYHFRSRAASPSFGLMMLCRSEFLCLYLCGWKRRKWNALAKSPPNSTSHLLLCFLVLLCCFFDSLPWFICFDPFLFVFFFASPLLLSPGRHLRAFFTFLDPHCFSCLKFDWHSPLSIPFFLLSVLHMLTFNFTNRIQFQGDTHAMYCTPFRIYPVRI